MQPYAIICQCTPFYITLGYLTLFNVMAPPKECEEDATAMGKMPSDHWTAAD